MRATPPPLTPFLGAIREDADRGLRALLGAPDDSTLSWSGDAAKITVTLRSAAGVPMRLDISWDAPGPWTLGGHAITVHRHADGADPVRDPSHRQVLSGLTGAFRTGETSHLAAAMERVEATARGIAGLSGLEDRDYRVVEKTTNGLAGSLRLGFRCNQNCGFCWQGRAWPSPPEEMYVTWLDELAAQGCRELSISGGEPTLHGGLVDLIERARTVHGMSVTLQTNAIQMRRPGYADSLAVAGLSSVLVSLHSADPTISDAMTGVPSTHRKTLAGIGNLLRAGVQVGLNCVVEEDNYRGLGAHARMVVDELVTLFSDNPVRVVNYSQPSDYFDMARFRSNMVALDLVRPHLEDAAGVLREAGVAVAAAGTCGFPACVFRDAPDAVEWRFRADLDDAHLSSRSVDRPVCEGCAARQYCPGPRNPYTEVHGDRGLVPYETLPDAMGAVHRG